jgi:septal ring factor EnvC (AmiA/AmiB activator)
VVECPSCGAEVAKPVKSWPVSFKKQEEGALPQVCVGIFECSNCKSKFRSRVALPTESSETTNVKDAVEKIKGIRDGFMLTLKALREKIKTLETERASMMVEIEKLKKAAKSRASVLESENSQLREEIKSLKELLSSGDEEMA